MSQIIGSDIIATPSHSSGTIVLPPSLLTLGGRQYRTSTLSRLISADVTLAANTLYFVYAQIVAGVPALRISTSPPSSYTISNPTATLVGAMYANAATTPAFGSFVNIDGPPETQNEISEAGVTQLNAFYAGMTSFTVSAYNWSRIGRHLFVTIRLDSVTPNGTSFRVPLPRGIIGVENTYHIGHYSGQNGATNALGGSIIGVGSSDVSAGNSITSGSSLSLAPGSTIMGTGPTTWGCTFRTHIAQWSATPLKDL